MGRDYHEINWDIRVSDLEVENMTRKSKSTESNKKHWLRYKAHVIKTNGKRKKFTITDLSRFGLILAKNNNANTE